jgi:hypothetical protein
MRSSWRHQLFAVKPALDIEDFTAQASTRAPVQRHRKNRFSRSFQRAIGDMLVSLHHEL